MSLAITPIVTEAPGRSELTDWCAVMQRLDAAQASHQTAVALALIDLILDVFDENG